MERETGHGSVFICSVDLSQTLFGQILIGFERLS